MRGGIEETSASFEARSAPRSYPTVDCARWGQTSEDLRHLALSAPHARTRERALALFDITQHSCATQVAGRTGRRAHTVMDWVHAYNPGGPDALAFRRTGGRRPFFCPQREAELGEAVCAAQRTAATPPLVGADPAPRWTLRRLVGWVRERFGLRCCRETVRAALHRLTLSWKKAKKLLGRADPERRQAFIEQLQSVLAGAQRDRHLLVYVDEAPPPGRGSRLWLGQTRRALMGRLKLAGPVRARLVLWALSLQRGPGAALAFPARQRRTHDRCAAPAAGRVPDEALIVLWDGAPYHRAKIVR